MGGGPTGASALPTGAEVCRWRGTLLSLGTIDAALASPAWSIEPSSFLGAGCRMATRRSTIPRSSSPRANLAHPQLNRRECRRSHAWEFVRPLSAAAFPAPNRCSTRGIPQFVGASQRTQSAKPTPLYTRPARGVAQLGRAPALGAGSRRFESGRPDSPVSAGCGSCASARGDEARPRDLPGQHGSPSTWSPPFPCRLCLTDRRRPQLDHGASSQPASCSLEAGRIRRPRPSTTAGGESHPG